MIREVYLDNNATSPIHPEVMEAIKNSFHIFGNASSHHRFGMLAREEIEKARESVAKLLGCSSDEIIFTSGGSESNNLVLKGATCGGVACRSPQAKTGRHIITSAIEHPSVIQACRCLEALGYKVTYIPVDKYGKVDPAHIEKAITANTSLISIMHANNEVGTIQPIKKISSIARKHNIIMHTDAVQSVGKIPINVYDLGVDFLSLSGHKLYGPKGIGALFVKKGAHLCPLIHGGHQERQLRAGTENTHGIIGLGKACEIALRDMEEEYAKVKALRDKLERGILEKIPHTVLNGHPTDRLPGTTNIGFKYIEGESILLKLNNYGIGVSTGSACSADTLEPSHVLIAMGVPPADAHGSIRFSLGRFNTEDEIDYVLEVLPAIVEELRAMSPFYAKK